MFWYYSNSFLDENKSDQDPKKSIELNPKRPTSIPLNLKDTSKKKPKARDLDSTRKHLPGKHF